MTELILEILDDARGTAVATSLDSLSIEITIQQDVSGATLTVQEFLEITELGPTGDVGPAGPPDTSGLAFIKRTGGVYAARSTVTNDPERVVVWIGDVAPPIDSTYALNNVDVFWNTNV